MKPGVFEFHRPETVDAAVGLLAALGDDAKILGGGQSLLPIMNMRLAEPDHLIDVSAIPDLRGSTDHGTHITYGGAVTHGMVEDGLVPDACGGLLRTAAAGIGYRAIRNRGTIGGSLAHADSSAEWPTVLAAANATVLACSPRGLRRLPVREFFHGFFSTSLDADELIVGCEVPVFAADTFWSLAKTNRKAGEFAESLCVFTHRVDPDGRVSDANVWIGAARDVPVRLTGVERLLVGREPGIVPLADIREQVVADLASGWDDLGTAERHRIQLHSVTVHRATADSRKAIPHE